MTTKNGAGQVTREITGQVKKKLKKAVVSQLKINHYSDESHAHRLFHIVYLY